MAPRANRLELLEDRALLSGDPPVGVADSYSTAEDTTLTVTPALGVLSNDTDNESDPLTAVLDTGATNGTVTLNADGSFAYTPNANFNGSDSFTYHANDGTSDSATTTVTLSVTAVNDAPIAVDDAYSTAEDTPLTILVVGGVLANDSDVEGDPLTAVLDTTTANGTLILAADGSFVYVPNANFNGTDTFTYHANDGTADSNIATVTITVTAVADVPAAVDDAYTTAEDTPLNQAAPGVLLNDTDGDSDPLTAVLDTTTSNGTLVLNADGSFTYTPNADFNGSDSFTYHANDGTSDSNIATVTITITAVNDAPVAVDDAYSTAEDTPLTVLVVAGVLTNDTDVEGNPLTAVLDTTTANGTLVLAADGSFVYVPNANFNGTDTFTYHANDGTDDSNIATVTITVTAVADVPAAVDDAYTSAEDTPLTVTAPGVLLNDTDADSDPLTAVLDTTTTNGTLVLNADGSLTYTPNANFNGSDTFTYHANDGTSDSNIATVTITITAVNDAPVAVDDTYSTAEDTPLTVLVGAGVLANDTDVEGNPLTAVLDTTTANGTLVLAADGSFVYVPNANFNGTDTFTYHANDGTDDSNIATVTITVTAVADAPVAVDDAYSTTEDTPLTVLAAGVLANDTDADGDPLIAVLDTTTTNGTLVFSADGSFVYTPNANFNGTDTFTYHANDGTADSNIATVTITVTAVADAPVAVNDAYSTAEDTPLTVAAAGVLLNDTDADGDPLTAVLDTTTTNGTLLLNANGSFTYTPNANFNGTDSFTYHANDGTTNSNVATVTITVTAVNDAPVAVNDAYSTVEDTSLTVLLATGVLANDTDVEGSSLVAILNTTTANGTLVLAANGSFTYTPNANFSGTDSFTYHANDGAADSNIATVTITVTAVNDAPVAVADVYSTGEDTTLTVPLGLGVLANDTDADGNPLTAVLNTTTTNGTLVLNANGSFVYTPNANFNGTDSFTYHANDGTADSNVATATITVTAVNDAPVAVNDAYSTAEDTPLTVLLATGVLANDTDVDGNPLIAVLDTSTTNGTLVLNANGSFVYTPNANFNGTDSFTYHANDGTANSNIATVAITVTAVADAPVAVADLYGTTEDAPLTVPASGVLANDSDPDGDPLTAVLDSTTTNGTLTLNANGSFTYTPNADFNGTDSFTYHANDGTNNSNTVTVTITITAVNDAPVSLNDAYFMNEDGVLVVSSGIGVLANDTDVEGDPLTAAVVSGPTNGTLVLNANGSFTYTPNADFNGTDTFTYRANDGTDNGNVATVTITVNPLNEAPVINTSAGNSTVKGHKKVILDPAVDLIDPDSPNFNGGMLDVSIQSGAGTKDFLGFKHGGASKGLVNARRDQVRVGKTVIGTFTGGKKGTPLTVVFNSNATQDLVQTMMQSLIFRGTSKQTGPRVVALQITDDTGLQSNVATKTVDVT